VLAGIVLALASPSAAFAVLAAVTVLSVLPLLGITSDAPPPVPSSARRVTQDAVEGVRVVAAHRDLRLVFGLGFAQTVVRGALNVFIVVVAFDLLRTDDSGVATLAAALGVGGVLGSFGASLLVGAATLILQFEGIARGLSPEAVMTVGRINCKPNAVNVIPDEVEFTLDFRAPDNEVRKAFGVGEWAVGPDIGPNVIMASEHAPQIGRMSRSQLLHAAVAAMQRHGTGQLGRMGINQKTNRLAGFRVRLGRSAH
jgi:hypothetical protein